MTKKETNQIITLLAGNYENIAKKTIEQKEIMVNTYFECLKDLPFFAVLNATKMSIIEMPYCPNIHDIRKRVINLQNLNQYPLVEEAWNEAYDMIRHCFDMSQEEFDSHSPLVKRFFGTVSQVQYYGYCQNLNLDLLKHDFYKQYETMIKQEEELKILPEEYRKLLNKTSNKLDYNKQIEGGKEKWN